jgi:M6 family metalloprotease-like protein
LKIHPLGRTETVFQQFHIINHNQNVNYLLLLFLISVAGSLQAMPPEPEAYNQLDQAAQDRIDATRSDAMNRGLDRPSTNFLSRMRVAGRDEPDEVVLHVPVILIDFEDNRADAQAHGQAYFRRMLFSSGEVQTGSVREFYAENSYEEVVITGDVAGWYRAPQSYAYYTNRQYGLGNYPRNAQKLAEDAIRAADRDIDFSAYDNDEDGVVDSPFIVHAGGGAEQNPNNVGLIWSHAWNVEALGEMDGVRFHGYTMVPEDGQIGVFSHELGHSLFGLPDLYDTRTRSAGLGIWSVMAYGAWGDRGRRPVQFDAWCKARLGWIEPEILPWNDRFALPSVESSGRALKLWHPDSVGNEYFLVEYRDRSGFDGVLPQAGLLVYHVDEAMENNDHPWWPPDNRGEVHDLVALEQADGRYHLEQFTNTGDTGDPFPGSSGNTSFDADSEPPSRNYVGEDVGVGITEIEITDEGIIANWIVGVDGPPVVEQVLPLHSGWNLTSLRVIPDDLSVPEIVAPLLERGVLVLVKDGSGRFYTPAHNFNNIPGWDVRGGYFINVSDDAALSVQGVEVAPDSAIVLHEGWQMAAYFPAERMNVVDAFASLGNALIMVKDGNGRFYLPRLDFNNMGLLAPGQGYFIKVTGNQTLRYPRP